MSPFLHQVARVLNIFSFSEFSQLSTVFLIITFNVTVTLRGCPMSYCVSIFKQSLICFVFSREVSP